MGFSKSEGVKLLSLVYFAFFVISLLAYYYRPNPYIRPTSYFALLSIATATIFVQVAVYGGSEKITTKILVFIEIVLIPFSFILTQQALYKTVLGRDPWGHMVLVYQILESGHIPSPSQAWVYSIYTKMPEFHLLNTIIILVESTHYKWSLVVVGSATLISIIVFMGALSSTLFREKGARTVLLSLLFIGISDNVLAMCGVSVIPNSVGVVLALAVLFIVLVLVPRTLLKATVLTVILSISLVFMHSVSYGFMLLELIVYALAGVVIISGKRKYKSVKILWGIVLSSLVLGFTQWGIWDTHYLGQLISLLKLLFLGTGAEMYEKHVARIPLSLVLLSRLGMFIYFTIAGLSILWELKRVVGLRLQVEDPYKMIFIFEALVFVGGAPVITFFWAPIAHRFWYYSEILGSIFVAIAFLDVTHRAKRRNIRAISGITEGAVVAVLAFLMFTASVANDDHPLVPQYTLRTGWYDSELVGAYFVIDHGGLPIASDTDYLIDISYLAKIHGKSLSLLPYPPRSFREIYKNNNRDYIFLLRKEVVSKRYFWLGGPYWSSPHLPLKEKITGVLSEVGINTQGIIYNNGNVNMYYVCKGVKP
ncbi:hypothetical protein [Thermococcus sp.]|uniref:hypothetical protein n=1 Tax=Thermococcus sp. TaxID=35749 RepID=UPI002605D75E|nr:hypothetical protein [Thermococcus sp.]